MRLFHGSNMRVTQIDLSQSRPAKDFGRAFYLSSEKEQAIEMARFKVETYIPMGFLHRKGHKNPWIFRKIHVFICI